MSMRFPALSKDVESQIEVQWAGHTFGLSQSFFDFYGSPSTSYWGSFPASDTSDGGWMVAAYTAQFGNGFSAAQPP